ncbi:hypothetical protein KEM52_004420, partial [Ascosphaera acerosa]
MAMTAPPIPITIITGFLGSGKTTLLLNLIPQLPRTYKVALLKNEFGDLAVDSQLASVNAISGPARIIIETSGSAFPATLAMEIKRLMHDYEGYFDLDG